MIVNDYQWLPMSVDSFTIYFRKSLKCAQFPLILSIYQSNTKFSHPLVWRFRKRMKISGWPLGTAPASCMVMKSYDMGRHQQTCPNMEWTDVAMKCGSSANSNYFQLFDIKMGILVQKVTDW